EAVGRQQAAVILDPGHGGEDAGVTGPAGLTEKALSLDISRRVKRRIDEQLGLPTYLTRSDDASLSQDDRASFANNHHGSLFISIHMAGFPGQLGEGGSIFYFEPAVGETPPPEAPLTVWSNQQSPHGEASRRLGATLGKTLGAAFPERGDPPLHGLPIYLLRTVEMPAVLMEPAVLSNPLAENELGREENLEKIAEAIFRAIRLFLQNQTGGTGLD
ncbi:MAG: N-acetylmuramoyl-L-alanine amidase, partial [bacterium]|nr:N-acetylmuramoyl-L-alanine amidase [bacterium]